MARSGRVGCLGRDRPAGELVEVEERGLEGGFAGLGAFIPDCGGGSRLSNQPERGRCAARPLHWQGEGKNIVVKADWQGESEGEPVAQHGLTDAGG